MKCGAGVYAFGLTMFLFFNITINTQNLSSQFKVVLFVVLCLHTITPIKLFLLIQCLN